MSSSRKRNGNTSTVGGAANNLRTKKKAHGWTVLIFVLGTLFPPLAVAARFGIGKDFWINLPLTIAGYIPGHVHNFYIQNIRNNKTHARTPKWAIRYGLVDDSKLKRNAKRSEWANRYNDRVGGDDDTYANMPVEEGQIPDAPRPPPKDNSAAAAGNGNGRQGPNGQLWSAQDERYYNGNPNASSSASLDSGSTRGNSGRWHYPANFDDAVAPPSPSRRKSKTNTLSSSKGKKDRWARTEEARTGYGADDLQGPSERRERKKRSSTSRRSTNASSYNEGPESAVGGGYGRGTGAGAPSGGGDESLNHEF